MLNYDEALNFISQRKSLGIMPGLSRIKKTLDLLDNPQDKLNIIHIAGTNGKGTVANTIANALTENGFKVGLFTSPWILDYREQIQINGNYIPKDYFARLVSNFFNDLRIGDDLTEFEMLTVIMYLYFCNEKVDYAVIECGMGGRGDATNVEKSNVCSVLTSISLDHTDFLGATLEEIIAEKEGIIRCPSPCFRFENTGDIDIDNLNLAKRVIRYLGISDEISLVKPVARQEYKNNVLLDGGHNPEAAMALSHKIDSEIAVIGMMRDKDIDSYLSVIAPKCKTIICTNVDSPRAIDALSLSFYAKKYCSDVVVIDNNEVAVQQHGVSLVCGSFYLIREIYNFI